MKRDIFKTVIIIVLLILIGCDCNFIKYNYETSRIKKQFNQSMNVINISKMVSQKDFDACYDIYFTSHHGIDFVITHVRIKNKGIIFYKIFKTDEDFNWLEECKTHSNTVDALLKEIDSFY